MSNTADDSQNIYDCKFKSDLLSLIIFIFNMKFY